MSNEVESWVIGLFLVLPYLVLMNWLQLGHMEGHVGYQHHWELQNIHIGVWFVNDPIRAHIFWNEVLGILKSFVFNHSRSPPRILCAFVTCWLVSHNLHVFFLKFNDLCFPLFMFLGHLFGLLVVFATSASYSKNG
jgi:hypothetical protein